MKNNILVVFGFFVLIFISIYLIFYFFSSKDVEWLSLYFLNPRGESIDFGVENKSGEEIKCQARAESAGNVFFEEGFTLFPQESKEFFVDQNAYINNSKNSVIVFCGDNKKSEIYKNK